MFRSNAAFLLENLTKRNLDGNFLKFWSVLGLRGAFTGCSVLEFITKGSLKKSKYIYGNDEDFFSAKSRC